MAQPRCAHLPAHRWSRDRVLAAGQCADRAAAAALGGRRTPGEPSPLSPPTRLTDAERAEAALDRPHRAVRWLIEFLPAFVVALILLPWIIATGTASPWRPATIDLDVYVAAVRDLLAGKDIYATRTPGWDLPYIYPPIAAILLVPFALLPMLALQLVWTALTVLAQRLILARARVPRGLTLGLVNVVLVVAFEPFRTTIGYGQVNTLLMALVVGDLLPRAVGERRWLPRGVATGLAAAIKLTPLLFLVFAFLTGRRRVAIIGLLATAFFTGIGYLLQPAATVRFAEKVLRGDTYGNPVYVGNQSLNAVFARTLGTDPSTVRLGLVVSMLAALIGLLAAVGLWRIEERVLAVGVVGLATCLASPLSWTHHHVWALLVGLGALQAARQYRDRVAGTRGRGRRPGLPSWLTIPCLVYAGWVALCPVLAFLPYGYDVERRYTPLQALAGNFLPLWGTALSMALLAYVIRVRPRAGSAGR
ncbi:hypothetical protein CGZ96_04800 [Enemella evansiae]|nr:hypothetical protein CGZ96_04800 [Enemella evansiae]